nr:MAG TPA: hypothetical protein [Caudoviricetes sp.]
MIQTVLIHSRLTLESILFLFYIPTRTFEGSLFPSLLPFFLFSFSKLLLFFFLLLTKVNRYF